MFSSSYLNSDDSTSSSSHENILENIDQDDLVIFQMMATMASNINDLFNSHEMEEGGGQFFNPFVGVRNVLGMMRTITTLFKTLEECDKLAF
jgi:hypothetical protein